MVRKVMLLAAFAAPLGFMNTTASAQEAGAPAAAASAQFTAGTVVYDATGAEVGKIKSVAAPNFVIDTGKNVATLALTALGTGPKGPVIGLTREQLDAAAEKAAADASASLAAAIAVDATVHASDGTTILGKISEVTDAEFVLDTGKTRIKLPKTSVAKGATGLLIGMTAQEFADATNSAAPSKSSK